MSSNSPTDTAPLARRPLGRILLVRAAFVCAVLFTLLVVFFFVEKTRGNAAWKRYQEEARAHGVKLTLAEYVPAPVPDARNFAAIPLFQDAFRQPPPPNPLALPQVGGVTLPLFDSAFKDQHIDLAAWQKFFIDTKVLPAAGENAATDVLKALERYAPQFEQLRMAGARPESSFPVRYEDGAMATLPHLQLFQSAARLYALRLAAHLALGRSGEAYEDFRDGLRLYTGIAKEPTLISGLVRVSVLAVVENTVWGGLVRRQWQPAELEKITADLAGVRLMDDYTLGLSSERGFSNMMHELFLRKGLHELEGLIQIVDSNGTPRSALNARALGAAFMSYPTGWIRFSQVRSNRYIDETLARASQEPPRIFPERPVPSMPAKMADVGIYERLRYFLFFTLAPALQEVERTYAYAQTLLDQTRLGCALERHRLAHGDFPASLEALAPGFLPALPRDVMNGEPLHYRLAPDGGYALYSVAWNLQDDGGKMDATTSAKKQPDWVWRCPAQ